MQALLHPCALVVLAACTNLGNQIPATDIALTVVVGSHSDHGSIVLKTGNMSPACGDLGDDCPVADIGMPVLLVCDGDDGAFVLETWRVSTAC